MLWGCCQRQCSKVTGVTLTSLVWFLQRTTLSSGGFELSALLPSLSFTDNNSGGGKTLLSFFFVRLVLVLCDYVCVCMCV